VWASSPRASVAAVGAWCKQFCTAWGLNAAPSGLVPGNGRRSTTLSPRPSRHRHPQLRSELRDGEATNIVSSAILYTDDMTGPVLLPAAPSPFARRRLPRRRQAAWSAANRYVGPHRRAIHIPYTAGATGPVLFAAAPSLLAQGDLLLRCKLHEVGLTGMSSRQ
jgi:hypothetical protein